MKYILLSKLFYKDKNEYNKMYESRFNSESTIHIPIYINGNEAFIVYSDEITNLIADIYRADKVLNTIVYNLPGIAIQQFTKKSLIDEIKLTNDLEGVYSTRKEISELLKPANFNKVKKRLYGLVQKYCMLLNDEQISIKSCKDIKNLYTDLVLKEVIAEEPKNAPDGIYFRKDSVSVQGADLKIIHNGVNPEDKIISYMDEGLNLLTNPDINTLISTSAFHYFIGYIHPYYNGNGRLSRFISSYFLSKELQPLVGYSLSYTIKKQLKLYYKAFKIVNDSKNKGDVTPFIIIFLDLIKQSFERLILTLSDKREQLSYYSTCVDNLNYDTNISSTIFVLVQNTLFGEEGLSIENLSEIMEVSIPTIRNYIKNIEPDLLIITKSGNKKLYDINLDALN